MIWSLYIEISQLLVITETEAVRCIILHTLPSMIWSLYMEISQLLVITETEAVRCKVLGQRPLDCWDRGFESLFLSFVCFCVVLCR